MPGYLASPASGATGVSIVPVSGLTATSVQEAISELVTKNTQVELKAVNVYADESARSTALPSPSAGQTTYLTSTQQMQVWNGTVWTEISGGGGNPLFLVGT